MIDPDAPPAVNRAKVQALIEAMQALPDEQRLSIPDMTRHYFADGAYAREMRIPAGVVVVGKIHKTQHICVVSAGDLLVMTENGVERVTAPATFISEPGTQRAVYVLRETVWTVFHPTHERDLDRIEAQFIAKDFDELERSGALGASWLLDGEGAACLGV